MTGDWSRLPTNEFITVAMKFKVQREWCTIQTSFAGLWVMAVNKHKVSAWSRWSPWWCECSSPPATAAVVLYGGWWKCWLQYYSLGIVEEKELHNWFTTLSCKLMCWCKWDWTSACFLLASVELDRSPSISQVYVWCEIQEVLFKPETIKMLCIALAAALTHEWVMLHVKSKQNLEFKTTN